MKRKRFRRGNFRHRFYEHCSFPFAASDSGYGRRFPWFCKTIGVISKRHPAPSVYVCFFLSSRQPGWAMLKACRQGSLPRIASFVRSWQYTASFCVSFTVFLLVKRGPPRRLAVIKHRAGSGMAFYQGPYRTQGSVDSIRPIGPCNGLPVPIRGTQQSVILGEICSNLSIEVAAFAVAALTVAGAHDAPPCVLTGFDSSLSHLRFVLSKAKRSPRPHRVSNLKHTGTFLPCAYVHSFPSMGPPIDDQ